MMRQRKATNTNSTTGRVDGDFESEQCASDECWLLEQTIRYHEERIRTHGLIRCEFCLSTRRGAEKRDTYTNCEDNSSVEIITCRWQPTASNGARHAQSKRTRNNITSHSTSDTSSSNTTILEENFANRLWLIHQKDHSDPCVLWRRVDALNSDLKGSLGQSKSLSAPKATIDWIASIPFDTPITDNTSKIGKPTSHRGMVCWLFEATNKSENHSSNGENSFPSHLDPFLVSATNHIAATFVLESSFQRLTLPERDIQPQSSASNSTEIMPNANSTNISTTQQLPPELQYDDDSNSNVGVKEKNTTTSVIDGNVDLEDNKIVKNCKTTISATLGAYFRKYKGGAQKGPLPLCWRQTLFTFVGSFLTIFFIHCFNQLITSQYTMQPTQVSLLDLNAASRVDILKALYDDYSAASEWEALEMGPFGATCVLVFAMTSVPPSQPRNMLFGASIGMVVGKLTGYLDAVGVGLGLRMPLAVALTASIMALTCTTYPPAGALSVIFTSRLLGWERFYLQAIGTVLTFSLGVILNNLHPMRTYPTFWLGFEPTDCWKNKSTFNSEREKEDDDRSSKCRNTL